MLVAPAAAQEADGARAVVVGGTAAVSDAAAATFGDAAGADAERVAGADRFATAAALAESFPAGTSAYVASGRGFADALAGGPAAARDGAPVLLVEPTFVPEATAAALTRLAPSSITVLGGTAAVDEAVAAELGRFTDGSVERLSGPDRYATAAAIAARFPAPAEDVYVASGEAFPDALAGGAAAGATGAPVLLVRPGDVPATTADALRRLGPQRIVVLGGPAVISEGTAAALADFAGEVVRLAGSTRYDTAAAIAAATWPDGAPVGYVASGEGFADALAVAPAAAGMASGFADAAAGSGPVFLTPRDGLPDDVAVAVSQVLGDGTFVPPPAPPANRAPVAQDLATTTGQGQEVVIGLLAEDPDGDAVTFALGIPPAHGSAVLDGAGVRYQPEPGFVGVDTTTYTATDGDLTSAPATVTITVTRATPAGGGTPPPPPVVDLDPLGPDAPDIAVAFAEGDAPVGLVDAAAATVDDPDGVDLASLTATIDATPDGAAEVLVADVTGTTLAGAYDAAARSLTIAPAAGPSAPEADFEAVLRTLRYGNSDEDPDVAAPRTITVVATDASGTASAPATATVTLAAVNDPPTAITLTPSAVAENRPAGTAVGTLSATDVDDDAHTFSLEAGAGDADNGAFDVTGAVLTTRVPLTALPVGTRSVRVRAVDGDLGAVDVPLTVVVDEVNDAPSFDLPAAANLDVLEDSGAFVAAGFASAISAGAANEAGQSLTFTVTNDRNGLFAAQPDLDEATGELTFTPAADRNGAATVSVVLRDDGGTANGGVDTSATRTFLLTVTAVNDAPSFAVPTTVQTSAEDAGAQTVAGYATGVSPGPSDEAAQGVAFTVTPSDPALFAAGPAIDAATGDLTYTPAADAAGPVTLSVRLSDAGGTANGGVDTSGAQVAALTITPVNDAPSFTLSTATVTLLEDAATPDTALFANPVSVGPANEAAQQPTFTLTDDNAALFTAAGRPTLSPSGTLAYDLAPDAFGSATVTVTLADDGGTAGGGVDTAPTQTFTITAAPVNDAPRFTLPASPNQSVVADQGAQSVTGFLTALAAGPDNEAPPQTVRLTVVADTPALFRPAGQPAIDPATGTLTYTPDPAGGGTTIVTVTATDDGGTADGGVDRLVRIFTIQVVPPNATPTARATTASVAEDTPQAGAVAIVLRGTDADGDALTFVIADGPDHGTLSAIGTVACDAVTPRSCTASVSYWPSEPDYAGPDSFTYTASDGRATSTPALVGITVTEVNDAPSFTAADPVAVLEGAGAQALTGWASSISAGAANEAGQTLSFAVTAVGDPTLFASGAGPAVAADGTLTYTPAADAFGSSTFAVTLSDAGTTNGAPASKTSPAQTFTVTVTAVNDAPSLTVTASHTSAEDGGPQTRAGFATGTAGPGEGAQSLTYVVTDVSVPALFATAPAVAADGTLTYRAAADASGTATVTVKLTDNGGTANGGVAESAPQTFDVVVTAVDDPPVVTTSAAAPSFTEDAGAPTTVDGALTVADVDSAALQSATVELAAGTLQSPADALVFTPGGGITGSYAAGTLTLTGPGGGASVADWQAVLRSVAFTTSSQAPGTSRTVTFTASDGTAASAPALKVVTVVPVNDAPAVTTTATALAYVENGTTPVDPGLTVTDVDSTTLQSATVRLTPVSFVTTEDTLAQGFLPGGITAGYVAGTGTLTLTGPASLADFQSALRAVRYSNASDDPTTATRTVGFVVDDGATPNPTSAGATRDVTVERVNDAPVGVADAYQALGNTRLVVGATTTGPHVALAGNVVDNDTDVDTPDDPGAGNLTVLDETVSSTQCAACGNVVVEADGQFTYDPPAGYTGIDTFRYTVRDHDAADAPSPAQTGTGTVTITVQGPVVWYVDSTPGALTGDTGRSHSPFTSTASLQPSDGSVDAADEVLFVYDGTYSAAGGLPLQQGQDLLGQPFGLTVDPAGPLPSTLLVAPGGTNPVLRATGSDVAAVTLANDVVLQRVDVSGSSAGCTLCDGVRGVGVTNATLPSGVGISSNSDEGLALSGAASGTIAVGATIAGNTGRAVDVADRSGGAVTFTGAISSFSTQGGVALSGNAGATLTFSGGLALSTTTGQAFSATGGGTVVVCDENPCTTGTSVANTLTTTTGTALTVTGTTIGAGGLTFRSIAADGAPNGIVLNGTGTTGGLTVTGTGTTDGSGGTIRTTTGDGVVLTSTRFASLSNVVIGDPGAAAAQMPDAVTFINGDGIAMTNADDTTLSNVKIARTEAHGIDGTGVTNLSIANSEILNAGDDNEENGLAFNDAVTLTENNVDGTLSITNTVIDAYAEEGLSIENFQGTATVTVSGSTIGRNANTFAAGNTYGEQGILARADGTSVIHLDVVGSAFPFVDGSAIQFVSEGSSSTASTLDVTTTTITNPTSIGIVVFGGTGDHTSTINSRLDFRIDGSVGSGVSITGSKATAISIQPNGNSSVRGFVRNTTVNGSQVGRGIEVLSDDVSDAVVELIGNTVSNTAFNGIFANNGDSGRLDLHIRNNTVSAPLDASPPSGLAVHGIEVNPLAEPSRTCLDIAANASAGNAASGGAGYRARQRGTGVSAALFEVERLVSGTAVAMTAFLATANTSGTGSATAETAYTPVADGACLDSGLAGL